MTNWKRLLDSHPMAGQADSPDFWDQYLLENPDVLHRLLADVFRATYGANHTPSLDELWDLMSAPKHSTQEFGEAVLGLLGDRSIRWLAQQTGASFEPLRQRITGKYSIVNKHDIPGSMQRIESVAKVLRVHPSYFMEWRRLWIMSLLDSAFTSRPELSISIFRRYAEFEQDSTTPPRNLDSSERQ